MRRHTLALLLVTTLPLVGCLQKDTSTTIYIRHDGTIEWAVLDQNVRSNEDDPVKHFEEERNYLDAILSGTDSLSKGFRALGGTNVRSTILRYRAPFATERSAEFGDMNQVWERAFKSCAIPHRLELKTEGEITTWTMAIQVKPEPEMPDGCDSDAIEALLSDSSDHSRIMLESGKFVSATGFKITGADTAEFEDIDGDTVKKNAGVVTFSLTWRK